MTHLTTRMMFAAATVMAAAGVASAQTMKAEIPFTFRAGNQVLPAGTYRVGSLSQHSGTPVFHLANGDSKGATILMPTSSRDARKSWEKSGNPVLTFLCANSNCALSGLWVGTGSPEYLFPHPKLGNEGPVRVAVIGLRVERSE